MKNDRKKDRTPQDTGSAALVPVAGELIDRLGAEAQLRMGDDAHDPQDAVQANAHRQRPPTG